jgi:hypothetical protein
MVPAAMVSYASAVTTSPTYPLALPPCMERDVGCIGFKHGVHVA